MSFIVFRIFFLINIHDVQFFKWWLMLPTKEFQFKLKTHQNYNKTHVCLHDLSILHTKKNQKLSPSNSHSSFIVFPCVIANSCQPSGQVLQY